jgi:hypothetical protein
MGYILKNTSGLINTRLTDTGRQKISQGNFNITYFQVGDSEVSYNTLPQSTYNQFNSFVLEPSFNAQNSAGVPQSNKENVKYPYYVDGITGNTYGLPFMASGIEQVYNRAAPRGFFTGTSIDDVFLWSAITNNTHVVNSNYVVDMSTLIGSNTITIIYDACNSNPIRPIQKGDFVTIFFDGYGLYDCLCTTGTTTTTSTSTTTTTTNPCVTPLPATTTTTTTCSFVNNCCPPPKVNCSVDISSCFSILTFRVVDVCLDILTLDRTTPDFSYLNPTCYARVLVYPSGMTEIYDSVTPSNHWSNDVINYESVCSTDEFDVKIWNMNIPWSETPAGIDPIVYKDYTSFGSINYLGSKEYFGYASSSGQTDTSSVYYYNSFDEQVVVTPEEQKAIAIVHYTNQTIDLFYGEKFALEPFDDGAEDTTGQARNFRIDLPWLMWHKNPNCCNGQSFYVDPPGFDGLNLFTIHYLESTKNSDMNDPGIRYYHLWDTNPNTDGFPSRVGKVFPDSKIIVFDDEEIVAAMSYKSNRNWTLPAPKISLVTPNICGVDNNSAEGILTGNTQYMYVTYRLSNTFDFTNSLHCNYYSKIQGPNISCLPAVSQNVALRFGSEFNCINQPSVVTTTTTIYCPCWYNDFMMWLEFQPDLSPGILIGLLLRNTNIFSNGYPIFSTVIGDTVNLSWDGINWVLTSPLSTSAQTITFLGSEPLGVFSFQEGPVIFTGYTECGDVYEPLATTICENNSACIEYVLSPILGYNNDFNNVVYTDGDYLIYYDTNQWVFEYSGSSIATLTGVTSGETPIGVWDITDIGWSSVTSSSVFDFENCECVQVLNDCVIDCIGSSLISYTDCYGVVKFEQITDFPFTACTRTYFDVPASFNYLSGDTTLAGECLVVCTTTTIPPYCIPEPITTTTSTICPTSCNVTSGFYANKFEIICQKVDGTGRPSPDEWRIIDFTDQILPYTLNGYITQESLTANTFVITQELYDNAFIYDLSSYIDLTPVGFSGQQLNFGDEYYFYGNIETDIQATIYEMVYKITLGQAEFQTPSNPSWSSTNNKYISEIGLYDSDKNLMIISKMQSPILRQGIQQFLIKLDI